MNVSTSHPVDSEVEEQQPDIVQKYKTCLKNTTFSFLCESWALKHATYLSYISNDATTLMDSFILLCPLLHRDLMHPNSLPHKIYRDASEVG